MPQADYYEILGVTRQDSEEEIRRAFRRKAMEYHPDRNKEPGAEEKFKEINEAYQVLSDSKRRAQYDKFGHAGVNGGGFDQPFDGFDVFGGFGDIFDSFFGDVGGRRSHAPQRGSDLQQRLVLEFEEAAFGVEREVEIARVELCHHCSGNGSEPGTPINTCATCGGNGQVRRTQRSLFGQFAQVTTCPTCQGKGNTAVTLCTVCRGVGMERRNRKTLVTIPAGVQDGMQVRLTGEGNVGANGGPPGNLFIHVQVRQHELFERLEYDLIYPLRLNMAEAALGVEKDIPTLEGDTTSLKVPQGTQPGTEFRIRGKGISHINSPRKGDLRVVVDLQVPKKLSKKQRELLEQLARSLDPSFDGQRTAEDPISEDTVQQETVQGEPDHSETARDSDQASHSKASSEGQPPPDEAGGEEERETARSGKEKDKGIFDRIKDALS